MKATESERERERERERIAPCPVLPPLPFSHHTLSLSICRRVVPSPPRRVRVAFNCISVETLRRGKSAAQGRPPFLPGKKNAVLIVALPLPRERSGRRGPPCARPYVRISAAEPSVRAFSIRDSPGDERERGEAGATWADGGIELNFRRTEGKSILSNGRRNLISALVHRSIKIPQPTTATTTTTTGRPSLRAPSKVTYQF